MNDYENEILRRYSPPGLRRNNIESPTDGHNHPEPGPAIGDAFTDPDAATPTAAPDRSVAELDARIRGLILDLAVIRDAVERLAQAITVALQVAAAERTAARSQRCGEDLSDRDAD